MFEIPARRVARGAAVGLGAAAVAFAGVFVPLGAATAAEPGDQVNLLGFNDFHGALSTGGTFACTVANTQAQHDNSALLSAGDNVGGTEFASAVQNDEPTIDFLNALGVDATAIGNHEYDQGYDDLIDRIEPRTNFPDLAANVFQADGTRAHEPYAIVDAGEVRVAVVGAVTTKTVGKVSPVAIEGLDFRDPVDSVNEAIQELEASGEDYDVLVASYHEGASGDGELGQAPSNSDPIFDKIVGETAAEVDAIFNGDSHQTYAYSAAGPEGQDRPIVQTGASGGLLGSVTLQLGEDGAWGLTEGGLELIDASEEATDFDACADNPTYEDASAIADQALADAEVAGAEPVGTIDGDITTSWDSGVAQYTDGVRESISPVTDQANAKGDNRARHSSAGNMLADSMKWYLEDQGNVEDQEVIGWMNPGGIRAELWHEAAGDEGDGVVTYAEANGMVPFGNTLNSGEVTGAQFKQMLEEQWQRDGGGAPSSEFLAFSVSENVEYVFDSTRDMDDRIIDIRVNGEPIDVDATYTIVTASFLFEGGDNMFALSQAQNVSDTGVLDRDAFIEYLQANEQLAPDFEQRQLDLQIVEAGEYDEAEGIDTDPVLRLRGLESESLGAPEIESVIVDAGEYGTFEAGYELNEELDRLAADVALTDWLCIPEGTEVPLTITAIPDTGTAITIDIPAFTWTAGDAPESCEVPDDGDDDGDDDGATPPPGDGDDDGTAPDDGDDDGAAPGDGDDDGAAPGDGVGDSQDPAPGAGGDGTGGDDRMRGDLARTGVDAGPLAAAVAFAMLAGLGALGLRHRLNRD